MPAARLGGDPCAAETEQTPTPIMVLCGALFGAKFLCGGPASAVKDLSAASAAFV